MGKINNNLQCSLKIGQTDDRRLKQAGRQTVGITLFDKIEEEKKKERTRFYADTLKMIECNVNSSTSMYRIC